MPRRNTDLMDAHLARELFAWDMVAKYLPKAKGRLAKRRGHSSRNIDQEWIFLAQCAAENCIIYGNFDMPGVREKLGRLFSINADLAIDFLDFVRSYYLKKTARAERWIMWNGLEIVVQGVRRVILPANMSNAERSKFFKKYAPKDAALASNAVPWGPELIGPEGSEDIRAREFEVARMNIKKRLRKYSTRINTQSIPPLAAAPKHISFFVIPEIPPENKIDFGAVSKATLKDATGAKVFNEGVSVPPTDGVAGCLLGIGLEALLIALSSAVNGQLTPATHFLANELGLEINPEEFSILSVNISAKKPGSLRGKGKDILDKKYSRILIGVMARNVAPSTNSHVTTGQNLPP